MAITPSTVAILGSVLTATALVVAHEHALCRRLEKVIEEALAASHRDTLAVRDAIDSLSARMRPMTPGEEALRNLMDEARGRRLPPPGGPTPLRGHG